ncbi:MAG: MmgE/PrpD family protein [Calditrichaeota bacterium]|nr:MmgE/PrpD family protein [Candidatus Cloacimonadota bacterium]MCA9786205.1 MmgE/PrpD family protein [Candidatus Cloacimonadota bacterium]MCB1046148.1 MmgE/PrpD family protein [Calditrichota bacterium]MCB9473032.1 MmgE/PrpD family protein [Candidatus Delongbacteria bacterium]
MSISRQIARFSLGLSYKDLPAPVVQEVKRYLYDSVGCAYGSMGTRDVAAIRRICGSMGGTPEATVLGFGEKLPAVNVSLLNSLMIRALDFNDIYWKEDPSHPSDLIPAALAVGELVDAPMEKVITAIVLAYEFEQRLCLFGKPGVRERGWHHATLTQFVSPIVAGYLLGLTEDQLVHAIGINGCHNHTIGCPTAGKLTMMKNTVDPMAVQSGVFAALMAREGYSGTELVFEGKEGLKHCFGEGWDDEALVGGLGESWKILECGMKAFPTEALTHTHLSATLKVMQGHGLTHKDVKEVIVTTIARACDILFDPHKYRPESRETADHSLPYCIAAAIVDGKITTASFSDEKMKDPAIWETIDKIKGEASLEFEAMFPAKQPSRVRILTTDGREFSEYLEYPKGDPREPMTQADLDAKFGGLAAGRLSPQKQQQVKQDIFACETLSCRELMQRLVCDL